MSEHIEALAAIEHERWAHWQRYLHSQCTEAVNGTLTIPAKLVQRWKRQLETPYAELSETEKNSDREQVRRYLSIIEADSLKLKAINALHRAVEIYGECEDGDDCTAEHVDTDAYVGCESQLQKIVCRECCCDEASGCTTRECEDNHTHDDGFLCDTRVFLNTLDGAA